MKDFKIKTRVLLSTIAALTGLLHQAEQHHLTPDQIALAWEDPEYRQSLTEEQKKLLPPNPAGELLFAQMAGNTLHFVSSNNDGCSTDNCSTNRCTDGACGGSTDNCSCNRCSTDACSGHRCGMMA